MIEADQNGVPRLEDLIQIDLRAKLVRRGKNFPLMFSRKDFDFQPLRTGGQKPKLHQSPIVDFQNARGNLFPLRRVARRFEAAKEG